MRRRLATRWIGSANVRLTIALTLVLSVVTSALPAVPRPAGVPLPLPEPAAAAGETLTSPRYVSAALMPSGQVGLLFQNVTSPSNEIRFKRYTSEFSMDPSQQLSTAAPAHPQLATFRGRLVAAYVDTRAANLGKLVMRASDDDGATWSAETYPLGSQTFDSANLAPRLVASRDAQTLYVFSASAGTIPQYRSSTDATLVSWSSAAAAGNSSMRVAATNNCGNAGQECYRAHAFSFMETATVGSWVYIAKSDSGWGQSGRGTQVGMLGGSWSAQIDHFGSGGLSGGGESTATTFLDRAGNIYYVRAGEIGERLYHKKSLDGGYTWSAGVEAYVPSTANYVAAAAVGLYAPAYTKGEYAWFAGFGGQEDAVRVIPLWSASANYTDTGSTRLFGSNGGDWDNGTGYPWVFGDREVPTGIGAYHSSATDLAVPGRLLGVAFTRSYNSADIQSGHLGPGWTHSYNWSVSENAGRTSERAAGAYTTQSSTDGAMVGELATDANEATAWKSASPIAGQWLQTDLERALGPLGANLVRFPVGATASYTAIEQYSSAYQAAYAANGVKNNSGAAATDWAAVGWSAGDWWRVSWSAAQSLARVRLWDHWTNPDYFGSGRLRFSDGSSLNWSGLPNDAGPNGEYFLEIRFPRKSGITWMEVVSDSGGSGNAGLSEVEGYDETQVIRSAAQNLMIIPTGGASATFSAISQISADYAAGYAANGWLTNGTGAGVAWAKTGWTAGDWWKGSWSAAQALTRVRLRDRGSSADLFGSSGRLRFSDASEVSWSALPADPGASGENFLEVAFPRKTGITWMEVVSDAGGSGDVGLAEVQAFDDDSAPLQPVGAFRLAQAAAGSCNQMTGYRLQSSPNASTWTDRHTVSGDIGGDTAVVRLASGDITARYWRLQADGGSSSCGTQVTTFELHQILDDTSASAEVRRGDGGRDTYERNADGSYAPPPGVFDVLAKAADGSFSLTTTSQLRYQFARGGRLATISEPAGNSVTLTHTGSQLSTITDSVGRVTSFVYAAGDNLARGKSYTKSAAAHGSYPDTGGTELTDGAMADHWDYWHAGWQGNSASLLDVTIDLGSALPVGIIRSFYYHDPNYGIDRPASVEVLTSTDNVNFTSRGSVAAAAATLDIGRRWRYELAASATARWVRLRITTGWAWIFSDEAQVFREDDGPLALPAGMERIGSLRDSTGRRVTYRYDSAGRLSTVTDMLGNSAGQTPSQHRWTYGYDGTSQHIATITDPDGRVRVTNTYDSLGRLATQKDGLNNTTTFSYGSGTTTITDPRTHNTIQTFDPRWRVSTVEDTVGANTYTTAYGYDAAGNLESAVDRNGQRTDFTHDARGNVLTVTEPLIDQQTPRYVTTYTYDAKNNLLSLTDAKGFVTTHTYDATKNVRLSTTREIDATTTATTKYQYSDTANPGLVTRVIAPRGNTTGTPDNAYSTTFSYDSSGNLTQVIDGDGAKTTHTYDSLGRRVTTVDPEGYAIGGVPADHTWTTTYDANDQVLTEVNPLSQTASATYYGAGQLKTATDRRGNVTTNIYDAAARLWKVQQKPDPSGQPTLVYETVVGRDANGNATSVTQANGAVTDYAYDALNRLTTTTVHPSGGVNLATTLVLDGNCNPTTRTTADSVTTTYTYDNLSRLKTVSATGLATITYGYDELSRRTTMQDVTGTTTYSYDRLSRLTSAAQPNGTNSYGYDRDSNRTSVVYPGTGGGTVTYAYSNGGRLNSLTDWSSRTSTYTYHASGLADTVSVPGGMLIDYGYDRAQRLTSLTNMVGATAITTHAYTLDAEGNRTQLVEFLSDVTTPSTTETFGYSYDGLNRLGAVTTTNAESFTLDGASNITARTGPTATYTIDGENRPTSDGTNTLTWSNADRLTGRGADSFGYDALDRLTSSTVASTNRTYAYSGDGLLQSRTQGSTTNLLWDAATSPSRLLAQGGDRVIYGLGPLYIIKADGTTRALARDGGKSVRAEVNGSGAVTGSWRYRAYGEINQTSGQTTPSILGYAGQLLDPSGLYYMRARWYDATHGRFLSADPLRKGALTSGAFSYAGTNPIMLSDPSGMKESTGGDNDGRCLLSCVSFGTLLLARLYQAQAFASNVQSAAEQIAYGPNASIGTGPGGVTIVNNAGGVVGDVVRGLGFGLPDNTVTLGSSLIVSTANLG